MQRKLSAVDYIGIVFFVGLLACVRSFETHLFYDPFLSFFKNYFTDKPLPKYDKLLLFFGYSLRYVVNMVLSLGIIWLIFRNKQFIRLSVFLYLLFLILLIILLFLVLHFSDNYTLLFYVRRMLIQPLFLLLFTAGFYYHTISRKP